MKFRHIIISAVILLISVIAFILSFNNPDPYIYMTVRKITGSILFFAYMAHNIMLTEYIADKMKIAKDDMKLKIMLSFIMVVSTITIVTVIIALMGLFVDTDDKMSALLGMTILCYVVLPEAVVLIILLSLFRSIYNKHNQ